MKRPFLSIANLLQKPIDRVTSFLTQPRIGSATPAGLADGPRLSQLPTRVLRPTQSRVLKDQAIIKEATPSLAAQWVNVRAWYHKNQPDFTYV